MTIRPLQDHKVPQSGSVDLTDSNVALRLLLESLKEQEILLLDTAGYVVSASTGIESQKGYKVEEIIGQHFSGFFPHQDIQLSKPEQFLKIATLEGQFQEEGWSVRKDGTQFWANVIITGLRDESGQLWGFSQVTRSINTPQPQEESYKQPETSIEEQLTQLQRVNQQLQNVIAERQQTEAKMQESYSLLNAVVEGTSDVIFVKNLQGEYILVNSSFTQLINKSAEEVIGQSDLALLPAESANEIMALDQSIMASGMSRTVEEYVPLPGGNKIFLTTKTPYRDSQGNVIGLIGITRDINDRKQAEEALKEAKLELEQRVEERTKALQDAIAQLKNEVAERKQAEEALKQAKAELETKVEERTAELKQVIEQLEYENLERQRVEEALQQEQEFTNVVIENVSEGVVACDAIGKLKLFNRTSRQWHGCDLRTVPPAEWTELYDLYQPDGVTPLPTEEIPLVQAFMGKCVRDAGMAIVAKGQAPRYILASGDPLFDAGGRKLGAVVVMHDITERKQAEEALQQALWQTEYQSRLLRTVIDGTPDWIFAKDQDFRYILVNCSYAAALGKSIEEMLGKDDLELGYPEELVFGNDDKGIRGFRRDDQVALAGEVVHNHYDPAKVADGSVRILDSQKTPLRDIDGNIFAVLGFSRDVTERHQVLEALRQSEIQLREKAQREQLLNRLASQIRSSLDLNQILETAVQAIRDLLQIDRCIFIWYQTDTEPAYWEIVQEAKKPNIPSLLGFRASSGEILPIAEKTLNKEFIWIDDVETVSDPLTRDFFTSLGYTAALSLPIHTQSGEIGVVNCAHVTGPHSWRNDEVKLLQAVCDNLAIAIDQAELYKQSRTAAATAQMQAQQLEETLRELRQTQAQMVQSEKMSSLGQLVAGVAHEINNPVNFIYGNLSHAHDYTQDLLNLLQLYQQHYPDPVPEVQEEVEAIELDFLIEDLPKLLSSMKVGADRIQKIVASLRNFSRMDEAEKKEVNIHEGIDSTLLILQNRLKARHNHPAIEVIKNYGQLPLVECYAGQLNQVFMNILTNALDALEEQDQERTFQQIQQHPSRVYISTEQLNANHVRIHISDNGPGISGEAQQRLFDPFFTTKAVGKGTGLGMSISYQIVTEKHGGSLQCVSTPGQGAEFIIDIPVRQQSHRN